MITLIKDKSVLSPSIHNIVTELHSFKKSNYLHSPFTIFYIFLNGSVQIFCRSLYILSFFVHFMKYVNVTWYELLGSPNR